MSSFNSFKALILGAGYGTRLERDLRKEETAAALKALIGVNKCLLPLGNNDKVAIEYWFDSLKEAGLNGDDGKNVIDEGNRRWIGMMKLAINEKFSLLVYVVSNNIHFTQFEGISEKTKYLLKRNIVNDGSTSNENRLGAVVDIDFALKKFEPALKKDENVIVIAGDTLFDESFDLKSICDQFLKEQERGGGDGDGAMALILYYELQNREEISKRGIIEIDEQIGYVSNFLEKPEASETESSKAVPAFYIYNWKARELLNTFLEETKDTPARRDAPGNFIVWLCQREKVLAVPIGSRIDLGGLNDYIKANELFKTRK